MYHLRRIIFFCFWAAPLLLGAQERGVQMYKSDVYPPLIRSTVFVGKAMYSSAETPFGDSNNKFAEGYIAGFDFMRALKGRSRVGFTLSASWAKADYSGRTIYHRAKRRLYVLAPRFAKSLFSNQNSSLEFSVAAGMAMYRSQSQQGRLKFYDKGYGYTWIVGLEYCLPKIAFLSPYLRVQYMGAGINNINWQCDGCTISSGETNNAKLNESQLNLGIGLHF